MEKLLLTTESNRPLYINTSKLDSIKNELESFCNDTIFSLSNAFPNQILFPYELKNNNAIEGYQQEISSIIKIINNPRLKTNKLDNEYQRIYNMYLGYDFILEKTPITEESLFKLYKILSNKILEKDEMLLPGNKYRHSDVFIHYTSNLSKKPDKGFEHYNIERHMEELFKFINTNNDISEVDLFFKSQIIHFYMVYIHPYFDINGRTARTTSLWFLNNNKSYPYTIFNRAITFNKNNYYKIIRDTKHYKNLTSFVKFVAEGTKCVRDTWDYFNCRLIVATQAWYEEFGHSGHLGKIQFANKGQMQRMSQFSTAADVIAVYDIPEDVIDENEVRNNLNIVLDNVQDPGNLGTIMRIADWYGIKNIFCSEKTVDVYNHKVVQATMGAISRVKVHYCDLEELFCEYSDMPLYGTFLDGKNIYRTELPATGFVVFGNEGRGISAKLSEMIKNRLLIPSFPKGIATSESLNVGMAAAITISEFRRNSFVKK